MFQDPEKEEQPTRPLTATEFAALIKRKYPDYQDVDDYELTARVAAKHADYRRTVVGFDVEGIERLAGVRPEMIRHWTNLHARFKAKGVRPILRSGYRTAADQNYLHTHGYPTKGNDGYKQRSPHQDGRSLDIGFMKGHEAFGRRIIAEYAREQGLYIPGDEPWHITLPNTGGEVRASALEGGAAGATETARADQQPATTEAPEVPAENKNERLGRYLKSQNIAGDLRWHFGINDPNDFTRLPRRQQKQILELLSEAVAEDERKKAAGQSLEPSLEYQNRMRRRVKLADNPALIDPRTPLPAAAGRFRLDGPSAQEILGVRPSESFMPGYQASGSARGKVQVTPGPTGIGELRQAEAAQDRQEGEERQRLHDEMRRDAVLNVLQQRNALEGTTGATDQELETAAIARGLGPEIDREQTRLAREQLAVRDRARRAIVNSSGNPDSALSGSVASIMSVVDAIATAPTGGISPAGILPSDIARKLLTPTKEGSLGTWETIAETFRQNPAKLAPILGAVVDYANSANQRAAGTRVTLGEASERDKIMLMRMQALEDEGRPFAAQLAEGLISNVAFMLEMAASGGTAGPVKAGVKRGLTKAIGKAAIHNAGKPAIFGIRAAAEIPTTAARLPYFLPRTMATYERRVMEGEDPKVAKFYALLDTYTEVLSEASGGASKYIPLINRVKTPKWLKGSYETLRKAGYHGTLGEYAEERVKDLMDMATGVRDVDEVIEGWQKPQQHLLELAQFAVPGMAMAAANRVLAVADREQQIALVRKEFDVDREDAKEIIDLLTGKRSAAATPPVTAPIPGQAPSENESPATLGQSPEIVRPQEPDVGDRRFAGMQDTDLEALIAVRPKKGTTRERRAEIAAQQAAARAELERRRNEPPAPPVEAKATEVEREEADVPSFRDFVEQHPRGGVKFDTLSPLDPLFKERADEYVQLYGTKKPKTDAATQTLVDGAAHEAATSPENDRPQPTDAQIAAGNYKKGHARIAGLDISIENPESSERSGVDADGKPWSVKMHAHYGYIRRSESADGEHVDVFVRANSPQDYDGPIFVVNQTNEKGEFDEHKAMLGWGSEEEARSGYLANYQDGWDRIGSVTRFDNPAQFKRWLSEGDGKKPAENKYADLPAGPTKEIASAESQSPADGPRRVPESVEEKPAETKFKFSSTQANLPSDLSARVGEISRRIPRKDLVEEAHTPHVTVKYGLHTENIDDVRKLLEDEPPIRIKVGKISSFPPSESSGNAEALKLDVDSADLRRLNKKLSAALEHTDTFEYSPHITLGYVKPGTAAKYIGKRHGLQGQEFTLNSIAFSDRNGQLTEIPLGGDRDVVNARSRLQHLPERLAAELADLKRRIDAGRVDRGDAKASADRILDRINDERLGLLAKVPAANEALANEFPALTLGEEWTSAPSEDPDGPAKAVVPGPKQPKTGSGRAHYRPETMSLSEAVRALGGIRPDRSGVNHGELRRISQKESGTSGLVNRKSSMGAEDMALRLATDGYRGDWVDVLPAPNGKEHYDVDGNALITAIEADLRGQRTYSLAHEDESEADWEQRYREEYGSDANIAALDRMYEDEAGKEAMERVVSGLADERETENFRKLASSFGVDDFGINAIIDEGERNRRAAGDESSVSGPLPGEAEGRDEDARESELTDDQLASGFSIAEDGTLIAPDGTPLFKRSAQQLGFVEDGLVQQEARPRGPETIRESEEIAAGTLGALQQSTDLRVSRIADVIAGALRSHATNPAVTAGFHDLTIALDKYAALRKAGMSVDGYLNQGSLFDAGDSLSSTQEGMLRTFERYGHNARVIQKSVNGFARELAQGSAEFKVEPDEAAVQAPLFKAVDHRADDIYAQASAKRDGHRVRVNAAGYAVLQSIYDELEQGRGGKRAFAADWDGIYNYELATREVLTRLARRAEREPGLVPFLTTVREAAAETGTVTFYYGEGALQHEGFHFASDTASGKKSLADRHAHMRELLRHPAFKRASPALVRHGYRNVPRELLVEEAAAFIWEGNHQELGLTAAEAADYLDLWFTSYTEANGEQSIHAFEAEARAVKRLIGSPGKSTLDDQGALLTPQVNIDLGKFNNLGFDSVGQAVMAIAEHPDWEQRFGLTPSNEKEERALERLRAHFQVAGPLFKVSAYHGSAQDFDRFSTDAIGTGEGVQAYGWGLYFSEEKDVAEYYRKQLAGRLTPDQHRALDSAWIHAARDLRNRNYSKSDALATLRAAYPEITDEQAANAYEAASNGRLYAVELAPQEDEYLLWDEPLNRQSEKVKQILADASLAHPETHATESGEEIYRQAALARLRSEDLDADREWNEAERMASLDLRSLGIRGIKYLDSDSRGKGEGTYNYVIFDDADISITARFKREADRESSRSTVALIQDVRVEQNGHRLKLNPAAYELLRRIYGAIEAARDPSAKRSVAFTGVFQDERLTRSVLARLRKMIEDHRGISRPLINLGRAIRSAAADTGTVIAYTDEGVLIHEGFHRASELGAQGAALNARHANFAALTEHPAFTKARQRLLMLDYADNRPHLVEETAAYCWEGDYQQLGLTEEEAADYLDAWFTSYAAANGEQTLEAFENERREAQQIIDDARSADQQRRQDVRRLATGRERGNQEAVAGTAGRQEESARGSAGHPRFKRRSQIETPEFSPNILFKRESARDRVFKALLTAKQDFARSSPSNEEQKRAGGSRGSYVAPSKPLYPTPPAAPSTPAPPAPPAGPPATTTDPAALAEAERLITSAEQTRRLRDRARTARETLQATFTSEFTSLRYAERSIYQAAGETLPVVDMARKFEQINGAPAKAEADIIEFRRAVVDPIRKHAKEFNAYLFLKRTEDRLLHDAARKKVGDWTLERTRAALAALEQKLGTETMQLFERTGEAYQEQMRRSLRLQVDSGRMTEKLYDKILADNDFYAPFKVLKHLEGLDTDVVPGSGRRVATTQDLTKAIKGITSEDFQIGDLLQASAEQIVRSRLLAEKNLKMLELHELAGLDKNGDFLRVVHPTRYFRIEYKPAQEILHQLAMQSTARNPQTLEQSFLKVGQAIKLADEVGIRVKKKMMARALGNADIGRIKNGQINLKAFTSEVIAHEMGHSFDELVGSKIKNVFGTQRVVSQRVSSDINSRRKFQKELRALVDYTGLGGSDQYRASAVERFAEFISLYIHDPKKARELAPTWTTHFETEILPQRRVRELVDRLAEFFQKVDGLPNIRTKLRELDNHNYLELAIRRAFPDKEPQIGVRFGTKPRSGYEIVNYYKNGIEQALEVRKSLGRAIQGLNAPQTSVLSKVMMLGRTGLQWGATGANATFQVVNLFFADLPRMALISRYGIQSPVDLVRFPVDWAYALFTSITGNFGHENDLFIEWLKSGAANSTIQREITPGAFKQTLGLESRRSKLAHLPATVLGTIAKFSNAIEETTKIAGLKRGLRIDRVKQITDPDVQKEVMARLVTEIRNYSGSPDFARKGTAMRDLNLIFMFLNARMQGIASDVTRLTGRTGTREAAIAWARLGIAVAMPALLLALHNLDDDELEIDGPNGVIKTSNRADYEKVPDWEREKYFMIPRGQYFVDEDSGEHVRDYWRIPKREVVQLVGNTVEGAVKFAYDRRPEDLKAWAVSMLENMSPINLQGDGLQERLESAGAGLNPVIKTPLELAAERDFFRHAPIEPRYMDGAPPESKYRRTTPRAYVAAGQITKHVGLSPLELEHVVRSTTAEGLNQFQVRKPDAGRPDYAGYPIVRRFVRSGSVASDSARDERVDSATQEDVAARLERRREALEVVAQWNEQGLSPAERASAINRLKKNNEALARSLANLERQRQLSVTERRIVKLGVESGARAKFIKSELERIPVDERSQYLEQLRERKILTKAVEKQLQELQKASGQPSSANGIRPRANAP